MHGEQTLPCKENDLRPTKDSRVLILGICGDIDICRGPCSELPEHVFKRDLTTKVSGAGAPKVRRAPTQATKMPKAWPVLASA